MNFLPKSNWSQVLLAQELAAKGRLIEFTVHAVIILSWSGGAFAESLDARAIRMSVNNGH